MRRILILHALLGTGHLSAARALETAFQRFPGAEVFVEDSLDFINPALSQLWQQGYKALSERAAGLYSRVYRAVDIQDAQQAAVDNLRGAEAGRLFFRRLVRYVDELRPDAVIAVMPVPLALMSQMKAQGELACPLYAVVTDYLAHSTWFFPHIARYFVPSELTADMLVWQGLSPEQLQVTGIPVNLGIALPKHPFEVRKRRGLPIDRPLVTLFGGGVDAELMRSITLRLLDSRRDLTIAVCAGRNAQLLEALSDVDGREQVGLVKYGSIDFVDDLIVASELVISKPGGLITSEVLARGKPMLGIAPLPGQEEPNADFLSVTGAGITLHVPDLAGAVALYLLGAPERLAAMAVAALRVGRPQAALSVAEQVLADLDTQ